MAPKNKPSSNEEQPKSPTSKPQKWKKLKIFLITLIIAFIVLIIGGCYSLNSGLEENIDNIQPPASSQILDENGVLIANIHATENRTIVDIDKIPKNLQVAFISVEDNRFYEHHGVDFRGVFRALYANITHGEVAQGGSTITQQLAKNAFLSQDRTFKRKLQEMIIAIRLERQYTKQEILEMYLNQIYFGRGAYGVEAAAQTYFGKDVSQLDLSECAMLAGIPRSPNYYSPLNNLEAATKRKAQVLDQMVKYGYITPQEAAQAKAEKLKLVKPKENTNKSYLDYFVDYITQEVIDKYGADAVYKGGMKIYVSLDMNMQQAAGNAVSRILPTYHTDSKGLAQPQAALIALDPQTGMIKAMIGGRGTDQFNRAIMAVRQPGSSFKPFVFATALENGYTPQTMFDDKPFHIGNWYPQNFDHNFHGKVSLQNVATYSYNIPTIIIAEKLGIDKILDTAKSLGISTLATDKAQANDLNLSAAIGGLTRGVTVIDMAAAYATFADDGIYNKPSAIIKILDRHGKEIYRHEADSKRVLSSRTASLLNGMLSQVVLHGTGHAAYFGRPAAGKTGTTDNYKDAWFAGYTPNLVTVVWVGSDDNATMPGITGGSLPARIWKNFMVDATKSLPAKNFDGSTATISNPVTDVSSENTQEIDKDKDKTKDSPENLQDTEVHPVQPDTGAKGSNKQSGIPSNNTDVIESKDIPIASGKGAN